jgi:hypothetical protein
VSNVIREGDTAMWTVERSDTGYRSRWATGRDAKHYIGCLGRVVPIAAYTFDVRLPASEYVTAKMVRA